MFCPNCGTKVADDAVFCMNCGTKLQVAAPAQPEPTTYQEPITYTPPVVDDEPATVYAKAEVEKAEPILEETIAAEPVVEAPKAAPVYEAPVFEAPVYEAPAYEAPVVEEAERAEDVVIPADYKAPNIILLIVSVLSCCGCVSVASIITSVVGLIAACGVKKAAEAGDMAKAQSKSKLAKTMWILSAVIVGLSIVLTLVFALTGVFGGVMAELGL